MSEVLVSTDWVAQHAHDANIRVVEVDVDTTAYDQGHIPGAAGWNWTTAQHSASSLARAGSRSRTETPVGQCAPWSLE